MSQSPENGARGKPQSYLDADTPAKSLNPLKTGHGANRVLMSKYCRAIEACLNPLKTGHGANYYTFGFFVQELNRSHSPENGARGKRLQFLQLLKMHSSLNPLKTGHGANLIVKKRFSTEKGLNPLKTGHGANLQRTGLGRRSRLVSIP